MATDRPTAAFEEGVTALVPHLRAYARALAHDPHLADDLVQDTVVLALQAWDSFTPGTNLKGWLFTILHNRFRSVIIRKHRTAEVRDDGLAERAWVPAFQEGRAELRHLKAAFARLNPIQREMLVLHAVHGLPYEEIAEVTGCPVGTVKSRINRARTALKAMLLDEGASEEGVPHRRADGGAGDRAHVRPGSAPPQ